MEYDYGLIIGFIGVVFLVFIVLLSYAGAYLLGKARGQRDAERRRRLESEKSAVAAPGGVAQVAAGASSAAPGERVAAVELAVESLARAVERMTDAQRVALLQSRPVTRPSSERVVIDA